MSPLLNFLVSNDEVDAYKNNHELGFVRGCINARHTPEGTLIFTPDMKHYTTEVSGMRTRYKFDGGKIRYDPDECWFLTYRNLNTQCFAKYRHVIDTTQDNILRDNHMCPVCIEPLTGLLFKCPAEHQVCRNCFHNLVSPKICPICRAKYAVEQLVKYSTTAQNRELVSREIQFTGKNYARELKFCGFLKNLIINGFDATLVHAGLFYYLNETHLPLLENKGDYSVFTFELLETPAWTAFFDYLKSAKFQFTLYSTARNLMCNTTYCETEYLLHMAEKYGTDFQNQIIQISRDPTQKERNKSKFKMYFEFVFLRKPETFFKETIRTIIEKAFVKNERNYFRNYELIEREEPPV